MAETLKSHVGLFTKALHPMDWLRNSAEQRAIENGIESITEALLNPAKRRQLKRIVKLKPSTEQAVLIGSLLSGQAAEEVVSDELTTDRIPFSGDPK